MKMYWSVYLPKVLFISCHTFFSDLINQCVHLKRIFEKPMKGPSNIILDWPSFISEDALSFLIPHLKPNISEVWFKVQMMRNRWMDRKLHLYKLTSLPPDRLILALSSFSKSFGTCNQILDSNEIIVRSGY